MEVAHDGHWRSTLLYRHIQHSNKCSCMSARLSVRAGIPPHFTTECRINGLSSLWLRSLVLDSGLTEATSSDPAADLLGDWINQVCTWKMTTPLRQSYPNFHLHNFNIGILAGNNNNRHRCAMLATRLNLRCKLAVTINSNVHVILY